MRLPADEPAGFATIAAASALGITLFDTARSYGSNESMVARALRACGAADSARIVTKGGMMREGSAWIPDGRAKTIAADCEASLQALGGLPIDTYLLHAPDPRVPWATSVRALARLAEEGLVRQVGVCNVNRSQVAEALTITNIAAVQVPLSPYDERAIRGGVVELCEAGGITVIAHSPFGGPRRAAALLRRTEIAEIARAHDVSSAEVVLAWTLSRSPAVFAIPGATRPQTVRSIARAADLELTPDELDRIVPPAVREARRGARRRTGSAEVVMVMGIPGAGKSRYAEDLVADGYLRLNRDERGGTLRGLAAALDQHLTDGARRMVLDNTYLTRALRSYVIDSARRHNATVRCVWVDTSLADAQLNLVTRMVERFGALPAPDEIRRLARTEPGVMMPTSQMRALRELEPPAMDEGFSALERVEFSRGDRPGAVGVLVAAGVGSAWRDALQRTDLSAPHLLFDWQPDGSPAALGEAAKEIRRLVTGSVEYALCPHPGGPPSCWCRPPLPGLAVAFAHAHGVNLARSILIGSSSAHRTLANTLGARFVTPG